jgi:hypothetical protein
MQQKWDTTLAISARGGAGRHKLGTVELIRPDRRDNHGRTLAHRTQAGRLGGVRLHQRQVVWRADVGTHLLELVGRASRDRPGWSIVAAVGRRQIFGNETAGITRRAIDDEVEVPLHEVAPPKRCVRARCAPRTATYRYTINPVGQVTAGAVRPFASGRKDSTTLPGRLLRCRVLTQRLTARGRPTADIRRLAKAVNSSRKTAKSGALLQPDTRDEPPILAPSPIRSA